MSTFGGDKGLTRALPRPAPARRVHAGAIAFYDRPLHDGRSMLDPKHALSMHGMYTQ